MHLLDDLPDDRPVLIAGATASGKSALALRIASEKGGVIVNADALQVWSCWRVLSARPTPEEETTVPHRLYGHVAPGGDYSVGHWLREVRGIVAQGARPIIVGGTGLYLTALTEGFADIPAVPAGIRSDADALIAARGTEGLLADLDSRTAGAIDRRNPARVQRAWEVLRATGRGLADWQAETGAPLIPRDRALPILIDAERDWLAARIDARFEAMLATGALDEVRSVLPIWGEKALWARAIGARELVSHLRGETDLVTAAALAKAQSRQYAKRQRTWFRSRMNDWNRVAIPPQAT